MMELRVSTEPKQDGSALTSAQLTATLINFVLAQCKHSHVRRLSDVASFLRGIP
jgi:hypothetical protein